MGEKLIKEIAEATGLPVELITKEIRSILNQSGIDSDEADLEGVRRAMAKYMREILISAKEELENGFVIEEEEEELLD